MTTQPILDAWAAAHGVGFVWEATAQLTYTRSVGAWCARTAKFTGEDDWIRVHPRTDGRYEIELSAGSGHVEVYDVDATELGAKLASSPAWFRSWTDFMRSGPGRGH